MTRKWSTACPDWAKRLKKGQSIIPKPLFPEEAKLALEVFKGLRIVDAPGSPTFGEVCGQWVFDLVASIFGAYDRENNRRLITEWFVLIPKKNSKSTLAAGIMITALILNIRKSAEFTVLAPTKEVADNSFAPAKDMCKEDSDPDLAELIHIQQHIRQLTHRGTDALMKVIAAETTSAAGKKGVGIVVDELWLFGKQAGAASMLAEATGGLASRPEGFVIYLTTQSNEPPAGVFKTKLKYARDVRDGLIDDPQFQPVIFEHPPDLVKSKAHLKLENLWMVNPNLGYSVDELFLRRGYQKAKEEGEEQFIDFMAKHGNVEIGMALRHNRWPGAEHWLQAGVGPVTLKELLERSEVASVGIDGGGLSDLMGLAVVGREKGSGKWLAWTKAWAHETVFKQNVASVEKFNEFIVDGDLVLVTTAGDDVAEVAAICKEVYDSGLLEKIGVDPAGIGAIVQAIVETEVPEECLIAISQGWRMTAAIQTTERSLARGTLIHGNQNLMTWCVGNAKVEQRGNAVVITKQVSGSAKIDPLMALFNAVTIISLNPEAKSVDLDGYLNNMVIV